MTKQVRGYRSQLLMGFEGDYGSMPDTPVGYLVPFNTESVAIARPKNAAATLRGTRNPAEPFDGNTDVTGDIVVPVDANCFGLWLRALFGAPVSTEGDAGKFTHVFSSGEEQPSLWVQTAFAAQDPFFKLSRGLKINGFAINAGGDQELTATLTCMGAKQSLEAAKAVDVPVEYTLDRLSNFMGDLKIDGAEYGDATTFSVSVDNGLDGDTYTIGGGGFRGDLPEGLMGVSGSMTVLLKDKTLYQKALESTAMSMELTLAKSSGGSLAFAMPHVQLQVAGPVVDGPAGLRVTWNWQAYSPIATQSAITATLVNSIASYEDAAPPTPPTPPEEETP